MARTAVIAGTATTVSNRVSRRQANKWAAEDQSQYDEQQAAPPPQAAPAAPTESRVDKLKELAALKDALDKDVTAFVKLVKDQDVPAIVIREEKK